MELKKWIKTLFICGTIITLTACAHKRPTDDSAINDANSAYGDNGAEASGLGNESGFGDRANGARQGSERTYYFDYDSDVVQDHDRAAIARNADYLAGHPRAKVMLEGHTDPRGSREYNIGLGERRAKAVAALLTQKGVSPAQIRVVSYGAEKLASPGRTESDYQLDRRVVLVYLQR